MIEVYIASNDDNSIMSLPANMRALHSVPHLVRVATISKPNGIAVYSSAFTNGLSWLLISAVLGLMLV